MIATIILLCLICMGLGIALVKHGEEQPKYNFWTQLIAAIVTLILYYYAGLFNNF